MYSCLASLLNRALEEQRPQEGAACCSHTRSLGAKINVNYSLLTQALNPDRLFPIGTARSPLAASVTAKRGLSEQPLAVLNLAASGTSELQSPCYLGILQHLSRQPSAPPAAPTAAFSSPAQSPGYQLGSIPLWISSLLLCPRDAMQAQQRAALLEQYTC